MTKLHTPTAAEKKHAMAEAAATEATADAATQAATAAAAQQQDHDQTADKLKEAREVLMRHFASKELVTALEEFIRAIK